MSDIDKRLDEILVPPAYGFSAEISCPECMFDFKEAKQAIKQLMVNEFEKLLGELEYRETFDMSLSSWSTDDIKAFGKNELKNELRQKLNQLFDKEK